MVLLDDLAVCAQHKIGKFQTYSPYISYIVVLKIVLVLLDDIAVCTQHKNWFAVVLFVLLRSNDNSSWYTKMIKSFYTRR